MKKLAVFVICVVMLLTLATVASAAFGTVVEARKAKTQPNLKYIDETWGEPVATNITSATANTYLWHYWSEWADTAMYSHGGTGPNGRTTFYVEDDPMDLYILWDDNYLYFGLKVTDTDIVGSATRYRGDGVHLWFEPAENVDDPKEGVNVDQQPYDDRLFIWTLAVDDWNTDLVNVCATLDPAPIINTDPAEVGDDGFDAIIAIPWKLVVPETRDRNRLVKDGGQFAIAFMRISATSQTCLDMSGNVKDDQGYAGGLCWGKFLAANDEEYARPTNKSLNTVKLSSQYADQTYKPAETEPAETEPEETEPVETETEEAEGIPVNLDGVSDWAKTEVEAGIREGLVPENLQANYTSPVTRGAVAQMFVNLLEKASGKSIDEIIAEKGAEINEAAFADTTDRAVLAANALGIINGTGKGKFSPDGTLKRAQIAAIINRVARVMGIETEGFTHEFTDITDNYSWADPELGWPVHAGIINGVGQGRFNPGGDLTTEQAILITYRALSALIPQAE
jgi:hypothetical protein